MKNVIHFIIAALIFSCSSFLQAQENQPEEPTFHFPEGTELPTADFLTLWEEEYDYGYNNFQSENNMVTLHSYSAVSDKFYNKKLAASRAVAIKKFLVQKGVQESRIRSIAYGDALTANEESSYYQKPEVYRTVMVTFEPFQPQAIEDPIDQYQNKESISGNINYKDFETMEESLGVLFVDTSVPELSKSHEQYIFTKEDALWMARFVTGEAGVKNNADGHAVLWAMFNRFGILRHRVKAWTSFGAFLQQYSTTLQPIIKKKGAAERIYRKYKKNKTKYPIKTFKGFYENSDIPKLQSIRHLKLQKTKWEAIHPKIQKMVIDIIQGDIPNPGIGIATEFAGTHIYYKQRHGELPKNYKAWENYTINYAENRCKKDMKGCIWIGEVEGLNQERKNAFFIDRRFEGIPQDAIMVYPLY